MNTELESLAGSLWRDFDRPDVWWQIGLLVACLLLAALFARALRAHPAFGVGEVGRGGMQRLAFPLAALVLVLIGRALLRGQHPVGLLSLAVPLLLSLAAIRMVFYVLRLSFSTARWLGTFERLFAFCAWTLVALHVLGLLPQMVGLLEEVSFTVGRQRLNLWLVAQGAATVVVALLVALWLGGLVEGRLARVEGLDRNLRVVFTRLSRALLLLVAVLISLPLVGIDLTTLSVFGGALGVGLGFGLQKIAANYVSGFIILLDRSIRIGNVIAVGPDRGQVTQITTRYTVLKGVTGVEAIVPNEVLVSSVVQNESYTDRKVRISLPVQVAYASDLERVLALLEEVARAQSRVLADPPPQALVQAFADSGIDLELGFWIRDPEAGSGGLRSDINLAIWRAFKVEGIEIPYPRREVRLISQESVK
ncbi:mechanosensitive ion channel family protein [Denitratisoma oestradiolicum]|uniref:Mechanosensitive ion channel protein MscS n=1 Tax=Denitratisoma oestradiolicum TaxID=311182 RepID=A0A6S6XZ64_9PROT|nr:mechanosensitive ion channel domain-containing protein [Denitratisoma oestradiolicum]TWO79066.1 mechanosensitive ion channel protein MscS [Denitratisoma oestradiolicum]CAB1368182.1 Mechanosensitive ion channel protein MscS [Denitratisoma oestradiolicum]